MVLVGDKIRAAGADRRLYVGAYFFHRIAGCGGSVNGVPFGESLYTADPGDFLSGFDFWVDYVFVAGDSLWARSEEAGVGRRNL